MKNRISDRDSKERLGNYQNKKKFVFLTILAILIVALNIVFVLNYFGYKVGALNNGEVVCNVPYILSGSECCLDENSNDACDSMENIIPSGITDVDFRDYILNQPARIDLGSLVFSLILSAIISWILGAFYVRYGTSISNRRKFAGNLIFLAITTTLVITIIKSSLALSLGLVGALSIVRFRTAIKEPEELSFLFLAIAIGLGLGANQVLITTVSFVVIMLIFYIRYFFTKKQENQNLHLSISGKDLELKKIVEIMKKHVITAHLKRFDSSDNSLDVLFFIEINSFDDLENIRNDLKKTFKFVNVSYLDKIGMN